MLKFYYPEWVWVRGKMIQWIKDSSLEIKKDIKNKRSFLSGAIMGYMAGYETGHLGHGCNGTLQKDSAVVKRFYGKDDEEIRSYRIIWYKKCLRKKRITKNYQQGFQFGYKLGHEAGVERKYMERILP